MARCSIALGGNQGDTKSSFDTALNCLNTAETRVIAVSRIYRTPPMGVAAGGEFLNATALLETSLPPQEMLSELHKLESSLGRYRTLHWGPRTIDLDLVFLDQWVLDEPGIVVPHPAMWYRRFVLEPLAEIAPDWVHPVLGETTLHSLSRLNQSPLCLKLCDATETLIEQLTDRLSACFDRDTFDLVTHVVDPEIVFASIERPEVFSDSSIRTQPHHEFNRLIRLPANHLQNRVQPGQDLQIDELVRFLRDILTAALPISAQK